MALLAGTALIAAACGSDDDSGSGDTTAATEAPATEAPSSEAPAGSDAPTTGGEAPAGGMTRDLQPQPGRGLGRRHAHHVGRS